MGVPNAALGYWLRQYSDMGVNGNTPAIIGLTKQGGANWLLLKCMDGSTWQGRIDNSTPVFSLTDVQTLMAEYQGSGLDFTPVAVPRGRDPIGEAYQHAALAAACGCLCIDLEPYAGFWDGSALSNIPSYVKTLRENSAGAYLVLQPDPRNLASISMGAIASYFDALSPQHYVGWTDVGWVDVNAEIARAGQMLAYGLRYYPTIYNGGDVDLALQFATAIRQQAAGFQVFSLASANTGSLAQLSVLAPGAQSDPCAELRQQLEQAQASLAADEQLLAAIKTTMGNWNG